MKLTEVFSLNPESISRCGFWTVQRGHVCTRALGLHSVLSQFAELRRLAIVLGLRVPTNIPGAFARTLCMIQLQRDVLESEPTFPLAQEQRELVWTGWVPVLLPLRRAGLWPATAQCFRLSFWLGLCGVSVDKLNLLIPLGQLCLFMYPCVCQRLITAFWEAFPIWL